MAATALQCDHGEVVIHFGRLPSRLYNHESRLQRKNPTFASSELGTWWLGDVRYIKHEMTWIGDLIKLETLSKFIVGGDSGARLRELKDLQFLREELTIEGLGNVGEVGDAREAALNAKTGLTSLILGWGQDEGPASGRDAESQMQILDCLQPHASIKNIEIDGYGGTKLPSWIGGLSFVHLERLRLCNCRKTEMLPSIGVLPQLKELEVERMDAICAVGPEFYGNTAKPFPALETAFY
ncbi:hypothetical protein CRG98_017055 [Punica granatum]|uniref:R13L1/DRL21-like LRR repeat region domain-containing protein n=1 Tax=Punica granatum TaxID=22663 RepID=A0A2I0K1U8_PUNGR|nr:hypothetical protein CRG98_017055 [Punica granatum]